MWWHMDILRAWWAEARELSVEGQPRLYTKTSLKKILISKQIHSAIFKTKKEAVRKLEHSLKATKLLGGSRTSKDWQVLGSQHGVGTGLTS